MNGKEPNGNYHQEVTDAVHPRFRENYNQPKLIVCVSCMQKFHANNILQVIEHYAYNFHENYHSDCLYCRGKVHIYHEYHFKEDIKYYHDCFRSRQGLDK